MHFQIIKDEYYNGNFLKDLFIDNPAFKTIFDYDDGLYPILGEFCQFIINNLENEKIVTQAFQFINKALLLGKGDTEEAIIIQVLQRFRENEDLKMVAQKKLSKIGLSVFNKI